MTKPVGLSDYIPTACKVRKKKCQKHSLQLQGQTFCDLETHTRLMILGESENLAQAAAFLSEAHSYKIFANITGLGEATPYFCY